MKAKTQPNIFMTKFQTHVMDEKKDRWEVEGDVEACVERPDTDSYQTIVTHLKISNITFKRILENGNVSVLQYPSLAFVHDEFPDIELNWIEQEARNQLIEYAREKYS